MTRAGRAVLMIFVGAVCARLAWTGEFGAFLQQRMRWPLLIAGAIAVALGLVEAVRADRDEPAGRRSVAPRVGWLVIVPMLVLIAVAPTGLGASAVGRTDNYQATERDSFPPLPTGREPVAMTMLEFVDRAVWDGERSLDGRQVVLRGFVVTDERVPDGFALTRFVVACCAADALPVQVAVRAGDGPLSGSGRLVDDTWVDAVVVWRPPAEPYDLASTWIVEVDLIGLEVLPEVPAAPYESPY